jgi:hypothetical protein
VLLRRLLVEITDFTIRLGLLLFPGIVTYFVVESLTVHKERPTFEALLRLFVLAVGCYVASSVIWKPFSWAWERFGGSPLSSFGFFNALVDSKVALDLGQIVFTSVFALPFSLALAALQNCKALHRFAQLIRVTKKFGDADVWGFLFNSKDVDWVVVRDIQNNLMFKGWVQVFSDVEKPSELLLRDVTVYNNETGEPLYKVGALYVARNRENFTIEIPTVGEYEKLPLQDQGRE